MTTLFFVYQCDDATTGTNGIQKTAANITFKVSSNNIPLKVSQAIDAGNGVVLSDFQIAIGEIELKSEEEKELESEDSDSQDSENDGEDNENDGVDNEIEYEGTFIIDLLDETQGAISQALGETQIPVGNYTEIQMEMLETDEADDDAEGQPLSADHPLFGRTVYVAGTINNTPFEMWHTAAEEFNISGANTFNVVEGQATELIVDFNLDFILAGVDLTTAVDGNGDGVIQIGPGDPDGNEAIADALKEAIKSAADFGEDENEDGELGEDEDVDEVDEH